MQLFKKEIIHYYTKTLCTFWVKKKTTMHRYSQTLRPIRYADFTLKQKCKIKEMRWKDWAIFMLEKFHISKNEATSLSVAVNYIFSSCFLHHVHKSYQMWPSANGLRNKRFIKFWTRKRLVWKFLLSTMFLGLFMSIFYQICSAC